MSKTEDNSKNRKKLQPLLNPDGQQLTTIHEEEIEILDIVAPEIVLVSDRKKPEFFECSGGFTIFD